MHCTDVTWDEKPNDSDYLHSWVQSVPDVLIRTPSEILLEWWRNITLSVSAMLTEVVHFTHSKCRSSNNHYTCTPWSTKVTATVSLNAFPWMTIHVQQLLQYLVIPLPFSRDLAWCVNKYAWKWPQYGAQIGRDYCHTLQSVSLITWKWPCANRSELFGTKGILSSSSLRHNNGQIFISYYVLICKYVYISVMYFGLVLGQVLTVQLVFGICCSVVSHIRQLSPYSTLSTICTLNYIQLYADNSIQNICVYFFRIFQNCVIINTV